MTATTRITLGLVLIIATIIVVGIVGLNEPGRMAMAERAQQARSIEAGAELFEANCRGCHGIKGEGIPGVGPPLNTRSFFNERLQEFRFEGTLHDFLKLTITAGRPTKSSEWLVLMPTWGESFGGPLRDDQIENLVAFILNWESTAPEVARPTPTPTVVAEATPPPEATVMAEASPVASPNPANGEKVYAANCSPCHGQNGEGGVGPALKDSEFIKTSDDAAIREIIKEGRLDTLMPPWKDRLSSQEIEDLIVFLKIWQD
ncbi:MAG: c-type cytochrome [Anaerolineae bacterium]